MFCISWFSKLERKTGDDRWDGALSLHRLVSYHFHVSPAIQYPWGYDVETPRVIYGAFYLPNALSLFQSFLACLSIFLPGACRSSKVLFSQKSNECKVHTGSTSPCYACAKQYPWHNVLLTCQTLGWVCWVWNCLDHHISSFQGRRWGKDQPGTNVSQ